VTYQKCVKRILKDEIAGARIPAGMTSIQPNEYPRETLGAAWHNFVGFLRDPQMNFTAETAPEAYKLLNSFRPGASSNLHTRLKRTTRGKVLLKAMQVTAGTTLGLMAWDKGDRASASKRYKEALDLAQTYSPFMEPAPDTVGVECWVHKELKQLKDNLDTIVQNDVFNDVVTGSRAQRRDVVELPSMFSLLRIDKRGGMTAEKTFVFATDACGKCGKRDIKLMRCARCNKMPCKCIQNIRLLLVVSHLE
jgi:hypothetical protein